MDCLGMRLGMKWGPTGHFMPISDDLWFIFAQVVALCFWL
jgi:hypothetical protein